LTKKKLRRLEIAAGAPRCTSEASGVWHAAQANKVGASATPGRASKEPSNGKAARQTTSP
jgi:hypothetical protein